MVLYVIGLGLGNEKDISVRGLEAVRGSVKVVLEPHASFRMGVDKDKLEAFYSKGVVLDDRDASDTDSYSNSSNSIYATAKDEDVSYLVIGSPLMTDATRDFILRGKKLGVKVEVIYNTSVAGAVASCGLQFWDFGQTVFIPPWDENSEPDRFHDQIRANKMNGKHTLCLLAVTAKEQDPNSGEIARGEASSLPPRYMPMSTALRQLQEVEARKGTEAYGPDTQCVGLARLGRPTQQIVAGTMSELLNVNFGAPPYYLVICGPTDPVEDKLLEWHRVEADPTIERSPAAQQQVEGGGPGAPATAEKAPGGGGEEDEQAQQAEQMMPQRMQGQAMTQRVTHR